MSIRHVLEDEDQSATQEKPVECYAVNITEQHSNGMACEIWKSAYVLLEWLPCEVPDLKLEADERHHPASPLDLGFFELGSATGFVAIALAKNYGCRVVASDYDKVGVRNLRKNISTNGVSKNCTALCWDWTTPVPDQISGQEISSYDYLIASDLIWGELSVKRHRALAAGIREVLKKIRKKQGFLVNLIRNCMHTVTSFPLACCAEGVEAVEVTPETLPPDFADKLRVTCAEGSDLANESAATYHWTSNGRESWSKYNLLRLSLKDEHDGDALEKNGETPAREVAARQLEVLQAEVAAAHAESIVVDAGSELDDSDWEEINIFST